MGRRVSRSAAHELLKMTESERLELLRKVTQEADADLAERAEEDEDLANLLDKFSKINNGVFPDVVTMSDWLNGRDFCTSDSRIAVNIGPCVRLRLEGSLGYETIGEIVEGEVVDFATVRPIEFIDKFVDEAVSNGNLVSTIDIVSLHDPEDTLVEMELDSDQTGEIIRKALSEEQAVAIFESFEEFRDGDGFDNTMSKLTTVNRIIGACNISCDDIVNMVEQ